MKIFGRILKGFGLLILAGYIGLVIYAYWPTGIEEVAARELAGPDDHFVDTHGLELRYRIYGETGPDRPNLVLIHGFGNSLQSFHLLAPLLADDYHVVTVDLPGFGLSAKPVEHDYRNANQAKVIGNFIRALGFEKVIIGGHSLGGAIALHVAINEPEINGLILFNPGIINTGVPPIAKYYVFPMGRLSAKTFNGREFRSAFLKRSFITPDIVTEEVIDDLMLATRSEGFLTGSTSMMNQYSDPTEAQLLPDVSVPTLIVWGAMDKNKTPEELEQLRTGIRDSHVAESPDAGHYVHEEDPVLSAQAIIDAKSLWQ
jgi:pimeloyl-ACP methyl ester carboxylesterase